MAGRIDFSNLEKQIGHQAAARLERDFRLNIKNRLKTSSPSRAMGASATDKYNKAKRLDRITFSAPDYVYKLNYGFEGIKKNGIKMRLQARSILTDTINNTPTLDNLADGLANLRGDEAVELVTFRRKNGR